MADGTYYPSETTADYRQTTNNVGYETNKRALETDREDYVNAKRANYNGKLLFYGFKFVELSALATDIRDRMCSFGFSRVHS